MAAQSLGYKVVVLDPGERQPGGQRRRPPYPRRVPRPRRPCRARAPRHGGHDRIRERSRRRARVPRAKRARNAGGRQRGDRAGSHPRKAVPLRQGLRRRAVRGARAPTRRRVRSIRAFAPASSRAHASATTARDRSGSRRTAEVPAAFRAMGGVPCVLEQLVPLACEVSVIVARNERGETATWPVAENRHRDGILDVSIVPARVAAAQADRAREVATAVAAALDYRGVLCVEMFVATDGRAARQRDRAAAAQQRPLHDRRVRHVAVRAAGARARGACRSATRASTCPR